MRLAAKRRRGFEWALLLALLTVWAVFFVRALADGVRTGRGRALVSVHAPSARNAYPTVRDVPVENWNPGLQAGDEILSVAGTDLAGHSPLFLYERATGAAREQGYALLRVRRAGAVLEAQIPLTSAPAWWQFLLSNAALVLTGALLLVRAPRWHPRWVFFLGAWCLSTAACFLPSFFPPPASRWEGELISLLIPSGTALMVWCAQEFTPSARPVPRTYRASVALVFLLWLLLFFTLDFLPYWGVSVQTLGAVAAIFFAGATLGGLLRAYFRSERLERRQIRWGLLGIYIHLVSIILGAAVFHVFGAPIGLMSAVAAIGSLGTPVGILVAVLGYHWLDVDRLISVTASYSILGFALLGAALAGLPRLAHAAAPALSLDPAAGQWVLTMALVAIAIPVHRFLRPRIDRLLFADRYQRLLGLQRLLDEIGLCTSVEEVVRMPGQRLDALLEPESIAIYGREESAFTPLFVRGRAAPTAFETNSPLLQILERSVRPIAADFVELDPFDRAALETLGVAVVVPTRRREALVAFTCLGEKRSGDIYTPEELAYLTAVANRCSEVLGKLDDQAVIQEARQLQDALRRYVPGAVAEQLASGADPTMGEREVTVLFVDLRGYASFAEERRVEEIFTTVNRYTEAVSEAVRAEGGSVVEFNGDGMMAVFGATRALAQKERAAVSAGRSILKAVAALPVEEGTGPFAVGVGIATGPAFVGSLRAADRFIWTALGATTNLAARLQALTRELDASLVVDAATWGALGTWGADFELHPAVSLRGLRHSEDVYALAGAHPDAARPRHTTGIFRDEGDVWRIAYAGREVRLREQRGFLYLAELLRHPGKEIHSLDLVRAGGGGAVPLGSAAAAATAAAARDAEGGLSVTRVVGGAGETIDARARAAYRVRLQELDEELAEAERHHDLGRLEVLQEEREALVDELADAARGAVGSDAERARVAVTKGLKSATDKIAAAHPEFAAHLTAALRRGTFCCYQPDPENLVEWDA